MKNWESILIYLIYLTICTSISFISYKTVITELNLTIRQAFLLSVAYIFIIPFCKFVLSIIDALIKKG